MSIASAQTVIRSQPDLPFAGLVAATWEHVFGATADIWAPGPPWARVDIAAGSTAADPARTVVLDELSELIERAATAGAEPSLVELGCNEWLLAVPILRKRRLALVAAGRFSNHAIETQELLLRLAHCLQRELVRSEQIERHRRESREYAVQVSQNFEELTFLRSTADRLLLSDTSQDFRGLAQPLLPVLNHSICADVLVLVGAAQDGTGQGTPQQVLLRTGDAQPDDAVCAELAALFHAGAADQPFVRNWPAGTRGDGVRLGVGSMVLVPVRNQTCLYGWLLAVRRTETIVDAGRPLGEREFGSVQAGVMQSAAAILAAHANNVTLFREKEKLLVNVVRTLVSSIEAKDEYTRGHSERVALFGKRLARELGYGGDQCERLYLSGLLHDVGKIGIADATLRKPGALSPAESAEIKRHIVHGWEILQGLDALSYVLPGVVFHHERVDGRGYPDGLAGEAIPLDARILAVADAYDAMTSDRPYRRGMPQEKAVAILRAGAGTQWDASVINALLGIMPEIIEIRDTFCVQPRPSRRPGTCCGEISA